MAMDSPFPERGKTKMPCKGRRGFVFQHKQQHSIVQSSPLSTGCNTMTMDSPFSKKGETTTKCKREMLCFLKKWWHSIVKCRVELSQSSTGWKEHNGNGLTFSKKGETTMKCKWERLCFEKKETAAFDH